MDALEDIFTRHSTPKVRPDPVPRELIEKLLAAGVQAPNHFRVRPWHFIVLTGEARSRLGEAMAQAHLHRHPEATEAELNIERARPLRAPVLIVVATEKPEQPKVLDVENICSAAAAAENILLAANALGLGGMWRTGNAAYDPAIKHFLGLDPEQHIVAFLYIGYPEPLPEPRERPSYEDRVTWLE